ncbi:MAG: DUF2177 family protein [Sphingomonadales bacterium]|nr:DUF2177 family protein [Sphingomonadales bacterium]
MALIWAYVAAFVSFGAMDAVWLSLAVPRLYRPELGAMLAPAPRVGAAAAFYVAYIAGMVWFAIRPGLAQGPGAAALNGALLGALCYATYDLTNQATLARWSLRVTLADMAWGAIATAAASAIACAVARRFA